MSQNLPRNRVFWPNFACMHNHNNERHKNVLGKYIFIILTALSQQEVAGNVKHHIYPPLQIGHPLRDQLLRTTHIDRYIDIYTYVCVCACVCMCFNPVHASFSFSLSSSLLFRAYMCVLVCLCSLSLFLSLSHTFCVFSRMFVSYLHKAPPTPVTGQVISKKLTKTIQWTCANRAEELYTSDCL